MKPRLSDEHHKAWALFLTRHAYLFRQIEKEIEQHPEALPFHLYDVVLALKKAPEHRLRFSEIADEIVTSRSALTRSIDKLEELGLIKREKCDKDRRGQYALLTKSGLEAQKRSWPYYEATIQKFFGTIFTIAESKELSRLLNKIPYSNRTKPDCKS